MNIFRWYRDADYSDWFFILLRVVLFWTAIILASHAGAPDWAAYIIGLFIIRP
jgi:hypothetical protein